MKKLINQVETVLNEQLQGFVAAHPALRLHRDPVFIARSDAPLAGKVALISGGGSGHEPMHSGFVGDGMLDGAVPGEIFTSPTPDQVVACAQAVDGGKGVLLLVKNYTGDVLNFETAAELLHDMGTEVAFVLTDDDVAVKDSLYTAGRRGVAGTVLLEKLLGAAMIWPALPPWDAVSTTNATASASPSALAPYPPRASRPSPSPMTKWNLAWAFTASRASNVAPSKGWTTPSRKCSPP